MPFVIGMPSFGYGRDIINCYSLNLNEGEREGERAPRVTPIAI